MLFNFGIQAKSGYLKEKPRPFLQRRRKPKKKKKKRQKTRQKEKGKGGENKNTLTWFLFFGFGGRKTNSCSSRGFRPTAIATTPNAKSSSLRSNKSRHLDAIARNSFRNPLTRLFFDIVIDHFLVKEAAINLQAVCGLRFVPCRISKCVFNQMFLQFRNRFVKG